MKFLEVNGYKTIAQSQNFGNREYTVDTATLYQLWNRENRVAGATTSGIEAKAELLVSEK